MAEEVCHGSGISDALSAELGIHITVIDLGADYVTHGTTNDLYRKCGLDPKSIANKIREVFHHEN